MKLIAALCCFAVATVCVGVPPADVTGWKFQHNVPGVRFGDATGTVILLNANGTFTGLQSFVWRQGTSGVGAGGTTLISVLNDISIPPNGTWAYRVMDQATAEIVIDGRALRLHFDDGRNSGHVGDPVPGVVALLPLFFFNPYDPTTRITNSSTRCYIAPGRSVSFGFVISGGERRVLVRAIGPGLRQFGIGQPLENPRLKVHEAASSLPVDYELPATSRTTLDIAAQRAGAFPLPSSSDIGKYLKLSEGAYIAEVTAADAQSSGEVLVEVYQLP